MKPLPTKSIGKGFIAGCIGLFAVLWLLVVSLIAVGALQSQGQVNVLEGFGVPPDQLKSVLIFLVNTGFGIVAFFLFIMLAVLVFRNFISGKNLDKTLRGRARANLMLVGGIFILILILWSFLLSSLNQLRSNNRFDTSLVRASVLDPQGEIRDERGMWKSASTLGLSAPVDIRFDASNLIEEFRKTKGNVVQLNWDFDNDKKFAEDRTGPVVYWHYTDRGAANGIYTVNIQVSYVPFNQAVAPTKTSTTTAPVGIIQTQLLTDIVTVTITEVRPNIILDAKPLELKGPAPLSLTLDVSKSKSEGGSIVSYEWDMDNDGVYNEGNTPTLTYTYDKIGTYQFSVRLKDTQGGTSVLTREAVVGSELDMRPVADFQMVPGNGTAPVRIQFDGRISRAKKGSLVKYEWNFGDGTPSESAEVVTHEFKKGGSYTVSLSVTDEDGQSTTKENKLEIASSAKAPTAVIESDPAATLDRRTQLRVIEGFAPFTVSFDAKKSFDPDSDIVKYSWDLNGDGTVDIQGSKTSKTWYDTEDAIVTLFVEDSKGNRSSDKVNVRVTRKDLSAAFTADPVSGPAPLTVYFDATPSQYLKGEIVSYKWVFGTGREPQLLATPRTSQVYTEIGEYKVSLTITTEDGKQDTVTRMVTVTERPLIARFNASQKSGTHPLSVVFEPIGSSGDISTYSWDFGTGEISAERKPTYTFNEPGRYRVTLTVADNKGGVSSYFEYIDVD